ncbi:MAG: hypothetical protein JWN70_1711 [Planctomycetaceae bacterium]|nr:hypothetical protein [Planctomycetaceae bacterium]
MITPLPLFHRWIPLCLLIWGLTVGLGLARLNAYGNTPGLAAPAHSKWPSNTLIERGDETSTLLMFIHHQCPCTRASLRELARITARRPHNLRVQVCVLQPCGERDIPSRSSLWQAASQIPGVILTLDPDGLEAQKFGALTSGHTFLYAKNGDLLFSGGITAGRGHSGDNRGQAAILALTADSCNVEFLDSHSSVFGCPLFVTSRP